MSVRQPTPVPDPIGSYGAKIDGRERISGAALFVACALPALAVTGAICPASTKR